MRVLKSHYGVKHTLGSGLQGKVKLGVDLRTNEHVALKIVKIDKLNDRAKLNLFREIEVMKRIQHLNVLRLLAVYNEVEYPKKRGGHELVVLIVLELAPGGELFDFLMYTGSFSEEIARTYFRQLVHGLALCHSKGVYHRDIKPENLLLDAKFMLKIADFGLSALNQAENGGSTELYTQCGTRSYMSPEVLSCQPYNGASADVWSVGVVLFILLAGFPPFQIATRQDWWFRACALKQYDAFWAAHMRSAMFSPMAMDLLSQIFEAIPENRISIQDILDHPWMHERYISNEDLSKELLSRKEKVDAEKDRQRMEKEAQKSKQVAQPDADTTNVGEFNPFEMNVHRSIMKFPTSVPTQSDVPSPSLVAANKLFKENGVHGYTTFQCKGKKLDIFDSLKSVLSKLDANYTVNADSLKIKANLNFIHNKDQFGQLHARPLRLVLTMYSQYQLQFNDNANATIEDLYLVDIRRREGDIFEFRNIYDDIYTHLKEFVCDYQAPKEKKCLFNELDLVNVTNDMSHVQLKTCAVNNSENEDEDEGEEDLISDEAMMI